MPSVLIVQPDAEDPPERLQEHLERFGFAVTVVRPYLGEAVPAEVEHDALVVLGGDMGAGDVGDYPWLVDIMDLLRTAVADERPTLGICLGGQLLAVATGGAVEPGAAGMEAGVVEVQPRPGAREDPLLAALPWPLEMITMHRDAIVELPPGARWLAESEPYGHQVFRVGATGWGVQFHPEVSPATYASWATYVTDTGEALRRVVDGVAEVEQRDTSIATGAEALARAFAQVVVRSR